MKRSERELARVLKGATFTNCTDNRRWIVHSLISVMLEIVPVTHL